MSSGIYAARSEYRAVWDAVLCGIPCGMGCRASWATVAQHLEVYVVGDILLDRFERVEEALAVVEDRLDARLVRLDALLPTICRAG